jgi:hypothetical protein
VLCPDTSLTKICIVSSSEDVELMLETLDVRRMLCFEDRVVPFAVGAGSAGMVECKG